MAYGSELPPSPEGHQPELEREGELVAGRLGETMKRIDSLQSETLSLEYKKKSLEFSIRLSQILSGSSMIMTGVVTEQYLIVASFGALMLIATELLKTISNVRTIESINENTIKIQRLMALIKSEK